MKQKRQTREHSSLNKVFVNNGKPMVQKHKRHRRGKKGKTSNRKLKFDVEIAFNNVNRISSSLYEIPSFFKDSQVNIFGTVKTFLKNEEQINNDGFMWIGKNRKGTKDGGGSIGLLIFDDIEILNDNAFDTADDDFKRIWIKVKTGAKSSLYIACVYFPTNGSDSNLTDEFYYQLLGEVIRIQDLSDHGDKEETHIIVMGDFNARIGTKIMFGEEIFEFL